MEKILKTYSLSNHCNAVLSLVVEYSTVSLITLDSSPWFLKLADVTVLGREMRNADPITSCTAPRENCGNADTRNGMAEHAIERI